MKGRHFTIAVSDARRVELVIVPIRTLIHRYWPEGRIDPAGTRIMAGMDAETGDMITLGELRRNRGDSWSGEFSLPGAPGEYAWQYRVHRGKGFAYVSDPRARAYAPYPGRRAEEIHGGPAVPWEVDTRSVPHVMTDPSGGWQGFDSYRPSGPVAIYEAHVRDLTMDPSSDVAASRRGTFVGAIEKLDYIAQMGFTHLQLLPVTKCYSPDEGLQAYEVSSENGNNYNWGYDPLSWFVPEGWYSSDPFDPYARIRELKELVREAHRRNLGIIMDVVYNHTATTTNLEQLQPGLWYRTNDDGSYTSASGCGNDIASENSRVRDFIIDSLTYLVREFHVDGFRFDLMGLLDTRTISEAQKKLRRINPSVLLIGEGWRMYNGRHGTRGTDQDQASRSGMPAMFNDEFRDVMKGGGFAEERRGFLTGHPGDPQQLLSNLQGNPRSYFSAHGPASVVNYLSCHDGLTLRDNIAHNCGYAPRPGSGSESPNDSGGQHPNRNTVTDPAGLVERIIAGNLLLASSHGAVFFHAGQEFGRTKPLPPGSNLGSLGSYVSNSYNAGDDVNAIRWDAGSEYRQAIQYLAAMLKSRREYRMFAAASHKQTQHAFRLMSSSRPGHLMLVRADAGTGLVIAVNLSIDVMDEVADFAGPHADFILHAGWGRVNAGRLVVEPGKTAVFRFRA